MRPPPTILIAGRRGQVAIELTRHLPTAGNRVVTLGRPDLDLADPESIERAVATVKPSLIVNAAAYTAVDKAEDDPATAMAINATGAGLLAAAARRNGVPIVHISTDYVFDGAKFGAYRESDQPGPLNVYGRTKLSGEQRVADANPRHFILRTAWVFSPHGNNFVRTMLRLAAEGLSPAVVQDQYGSPTAAADLARVITALVSRLTSGSPPEAEYGVFHVASRGHTSRYEFARAIMAETAQRGGTATDIRPIRTTEAPTAARRPGNSVLASGKLSAVFGLALPHWQDALSACMDELHGRNTQQTGP